MDKAMDKAIGAFSILISLAVVAVGANALMILNSI